MIVKTGPRSLTIMFTGYFVCTKPQLRHESSLCRVSEFLFSFGEDPIFCWKVRNIERGLFILCRSNVNMLRMVKRLYVYFDHSSFS